MLFGGPRSVAGAGKRKGTGPAVGPPGGLIS